MTSIDLHLRPHCIKFLSKHIFKGTEEPRVCYRRMLRHMIDALIEPKPIKAVADYKHHTVLEYPIPERVIKNPSIHPHRKQLWIPPDSMNMIDAHVDSLFKFEFMIAARYLGHSMDIGDAIMIVFNSYDITQQDYSLESAKRHEVRSRMPLNTLIVGR